MQCKQREREREKKKKSRAMLSTHFHFWFPLSWVCLAQTKLVSCIPKSSPAHGDRNPPSDSNMAPSTKVATQMPVLLEVTIAVAGAIWGKTKIKQDNKQFKKRNAKLKLTKHVCRLATWNIMRKHVCNHKLFLTGR